MAWGVDKVQLIGFTISRFVIQRNALRLNGDTAFAFQVHGVQNLGFHFTIRQATANLDNTVRQRRLTVVNVSNDGEISYVLHMYEFIYSLCGLNLLDGHSGGHSTVTTPSTTGMHITL